MEKQEFVISISAVKVSNKTYISLDDLLLGLYDAKDKGVKQLITKDLIDSLKELESKKD